MCGELTDLILLGGLRTFPELDTYQSAYWKDAEHSYLFEHICSVETSFSRVESLMNSFVCILEIEFSVLNMAAAGAVATTDWFTKFTLQSIHISYYLLGLDSRVRELKCSPV